MLYLVTEIDYGMYESERDTVKLLMIADNPQSILQMMEKWTKKMKEDVTVSEIEASQINTLINLSMMNPYYSVSAEKFWQTHSAAKVNPKVKK